MTEATPGTEAARLAALRRYSILDTPTEAAFDRITRLAARILDVPIALISLVDGERQWFKSSFGSTATETPRTVSFCAHAIGADAVMVVPDARQDRRFTRNPLVTGDPGIRFYAGAPLVTPDGFALGTLCAIDTQPRQLSAAAAATLADLAAMVMDELELRRIALHAVATAEAAQRAGERRYRQAFEDNQAVKLILDPSSGAIIEANAAAASFYGYSKAVLEQLSLADINALPAAEREQRVQGALRPGAGAFPSRHRLISGEVRDVEVFASPITVDDKLLLFTIVQDVTERKRGETTLAQERHFLEAMLDNTNTGIVACEADGRLRLFNRATREFHGLPVAALSPDQWADHYDLYAADGSTRLETTDIPLFRALQGEPVRNVEMMIVPKQGQARTVLVNGSLITDTAGQTLGAVVAMHDISERKRAEAQLTHQAFHDSLTDLPNRALFLDRLEHALARTGRSAGAVTVLFIDLDDFKAINDMHGHSAGDVLLQEMAQRLCAAVHTEDTVARLGGDEFVVLLEERGSVSEAIPAAQRLLAAIQQPLVLAHQELLLTASIGLASSTGPGDQVAELLRQADVAMRQAKAVGRGGVAVFDPAMDAVLVATRELEFGLQQALARQELRVYYQPVVDLATEVIVGVEALVRWQHPELGLVSPATFIPLAEANGQILAIGGWVCREACRQAQAWQALLPAEPPLTVSVNLSAREFQCLTLVEEVAAILQETGLPPSSLCLEVTETAAMQDIDATMRTLQAFKALGVRIALDDFGTGYSSLSYLQRLPLDTVKLDRSFVQRLPDDAGTRVIVQSVVTLAHALDMQVTAEGMETCEELLLVQRMGCDMAQGYWFSRPLPASELTALLLRGACVAAA